MGTKRFREISNTKILFAIYTSLVVLFVTIPIITTVAISFTTTAYPEFPPVGFTLHWYTRFFENAQLVKGFYLSIQIAFLAAVSSAIIGFVASYPLVRYDFPGKDTITTLIMGPIALPTIIIGLSLFEFFVLTRIIHFSEFLSLFLGHLIITFPYSVRMISSALTIVDVSLENAAINLGASRLRVFRSILLPLIKPAFFASFLFTFVVSFDNVPISICLSRGVLVPFPVLLMNMMELHIDPSIAAPAVFFVLLATAMIIVTEKIVGLEFALGA